MLRARCLARSGASLVQHHQQQKSSILRQCTRTHQAPSYQRRSAVRVMGFINSKQEELVGRARQYIGAWGSGARSELEPMIAEHCVFKADGVLYHKDLHGRDAIMSACNSSHKVHEHVSYIPVAAAANEEDNVAFAAVAWEFKERAAGHEGDVSKGISLKKLTFDDKGHLVGTRVCRQLTPGERQALLKPGFEAHPVDVYKEVLKLLPQAAGEVSGKDDEEQYTQMKDNLLGWVAAWSSDSGEAKALDKVLSPDLKGYDCYGLHGICGDAAHHEGQAMSGREEAEAAVEEVHKDWSNRNELLAWAVNQDQRVGFDHWRGHVHKRGEEASVGGEAFKMEGMDLVLFGDDGMITHLLKFDMQDYSSKMKEEGAPEGPPGSTA